MRHFIILAGLAALAAAVPVDMSTDMANDMAHDKGPELASDVSYGRYSPYKYYGSYGDYGWKAAGDDEAKTGMENSTPHFTYSSCILNTPVLCTLSIDE